MELDWYLYFMVLFSSLQQTIPTVQHQRMATKTLKCLATQTCHLDVCLLSALHYRWACLHHQATLLGVTCQLAGQQPFLCRLSQAVEMLCLKRSQQTIRWCRDLGIWTLKRACWKVGVRYMYIATSCLNECVSRLPWAVLSVQFPKVISKKHSIESRFLEPPRLMKIGEFEKSARGGGDAVF